MTGLEPGWATWLRPYQAVLREREPSWRVRAAVRCDSIRKSE